MSELPSVEGSLWKLKASLTGASWKKHWAFTDGVKICQWRSKSKPSITEAPKYTLYLKDCKISDYQGRKYGFKISENNSNLSLVLAVDDFDSYEKWLKILIRNENDTPDNIDTAIFPADFDMEGVMLKIWLLPMTRERNLLKKQDQTLFWITSSSTTCTM